jgi:hypothetical protein
MSSRRLVAFSLLAISGVFSILGYTQTTGYDQNLSKRSGNLVLCQV